MRTLRSQYGLASSVVMGKEGLLEVVPGISGRGGAWWSADTVVCSKPMADCWRRYFSDE